jgi:hypothetical protein
MFVLLYREMWMRRILPDRPERQVGGKYKSAAGVPWTMLLAEIVNPIRLGFSSRSNKMVELSGFEPLACTMRTYRSTN